MTSPSSSSSSSSTKECVFGARGIDIRDLVVAREDDEEHSRGGGFGGGFFGGFSADAASSSSSSKTAPMLPMPPMPVIFTTTTASSTSKTAQRRASSASINHQHLHQQCHPFTLINPSTSSSTADRIILALDLPDDYEDDDMMSTVGIPVATTDDHLHASSSPMSSSPPPLQTRSRRPSSSSSILSIDGTAPAAAAVDTLMYVQTSASFKGLFVSQEDAHAIGLDIVGECDTVYGLLPKYSPVVVAAGSCHTTTPDVYQLPPEFAGTRFGGGMLGMPILWSLGVSVAIDRGNVHLVYPRDDVIAMHDGTARSWTRRRPLFSDGRGSGFGGGHDDVPSMTII